MAAEGLIYVQFSSELRDKLGEQLSLETILAQAGIEADVEFHALPSTQPGERGKALVETVMLVAMGAVSVAVAIKAIESAITHFLDHKAVRDSHFERWVNVPVIGENGKPVLDAKGKPLLVRERVGGFDDYPDIPGEGVALTVGDEGISVTLGQQASRQAPAIKAPKE